MALPPEERAAYLAQHCVDAQQRAALERLLDADRDICARMLDQPLDAMLDRIGDDEPRLPPLGGTVGPFTLLEELGAGGSSIVFRARREQAGVTQTVALKLLRRGVYSAEEQRQFRRERLALAQLQHPGIARLIEGGFTAAGIPYIALELVDGRPITEYVCAERLDLRGRLVVFAAVCRAVDAAHRALIVHRDLKPSNVLVTRDGEVKLLDFGIAKLLDIEAEEGVHTDYCAMTPAYAAPEQFDRGMITTATDVYALGVLLSELITGSRREANDNRTPSSRINAGAAPGVLPAAPAATRRQLRGDLDNIVMKATAGEPERRYASAGALADDIERHLAGKPTAAHPPTTWYRTSKFVVRHKGIVLASLTFLLALLAAFAVTAWQARIAWLQARRADAVQAFLVDVFQTNSSYQEDQVKARATTAQQLLELGAKKIDGTMADAPDAKLQLLMLLGQMHSDLGLDEQAAYLYRKAVDLAHGQHGEHSLDAFAAQIRLADALHSANSDDAAKIVLEQARDTLERNHDDDAYRRALLADQFGQYYATRDPPKALDYARTSVALYDRARARADLGFALSRKARAERQSGLDSDAIASYERAIEVSRAADGAANPDLVRYYAELSEMRFFHLDIAGGERDARAALQLATSIHGEDHVDVVQCEMRLGRLLFDTAREQEGLALLASAKRKILALRGPDDGFHTPQVLFQNAIALIRSGRIEEGLEDVRAAIANRRRNRPGTIPLAQFLESAAVANVEMGRFEEAAGNLDEAQAIREKAGQKTPSQPFDGNIVPRIQLALAQEQYDHAVELLLQLSASAADESRPNMGRITNALLAAGVRAAVGQPAQAIATVSGLRKEIEAGALAPYCRRLLANAAFIEGSAELSRGNADAAIPFLQDALAEREKTLDPHSPEIAEVQIALAESYFKAGAVAKARTLADAADAIEAAHTELGPQYRKPLQDLQAKLASLPTTSP